MYRFIIIVLFYLCLPLIVLCQELTDEPSELNLDTLNSKLSEELSYTYYTEKNWKKTIDLCNSAIKQGIDYYYLRMRIAIAYYELKQYREAEKHFLKALTFDSQSSTAMEYLYYCYVYNEKLLIAANQLKLSTQKLFINYIFIEGGQKLPQGKDPVKVATPLNIGLFQKFWKKNAVLFSFGNYFQEIKPGNHSQYQYYTGLFFPLSPSLTFIPSIHIISSRWEVLLKYPIPPIPPPGFVQKEKLQITKSYFYLFQMGMMRSGIYYDITPTISMLTVDDSTWQNGYDSSFYQLNLGLNFYPLKRNSISFGNIFMYQKTNKDYTFGNKVLFHTNLFKYFKLSLDYYFGNMRFNTQDFGFFINNDYSITLNKFSIMPEITIKKRFVVYLLYQYETKNFYNDKTDFNYNNYIFGLKYLYK